jgi:AcrR family transcriptional regulator
MEKEKIDQRVRLTRNLLKDALVQLMQEQHISKISVRALCEVADINRSTFYMHYTDQYDLLNKVEQEVLDNLNRYLEKQDFNYSRPISVQVLTRILDYFKENVELFKALLSENCDFAFQKDLMELAQVISSQINQSLDLKTQDYIKTFCLTGAISMLQKWLQDGMDESSAQMSEFIVQVLYYGITSLKKDALS